MKKQCFNSRGFTLVELSVVIVIIGVLAAFGVPKFRSAVERSKAAEAYNYLSSVATAQERYAARQGTYAGQLTELDMAMSTPKYFTIGVIGPGSTGDLEDSWTLTMTRSGNSAGYGAYTVTYNDQGYDPTNSTINGFPDINPMQTN
jgi:prepilin-type N-terminal cleavage/methylation domain-containing protein